MNNIGEVIQESDEVFCTWHGIKGTNVFYDSAHHLHYLTQHGVIVAVKHTLSEMAQEYVLENLERVAMPHEKHIDTEPILTDTQDDRERRQGNITFWICVIVLTAVAFFVLFMIMRMYWVANHPASSLVGAIWKS